MYIPKWFEWSKDVDNDILSTYAKRGIVIAEPIKQGRSKLNKKDTERMWLYGGKKVLLLSWGNLPLLIWRDHCRCSIEWWISSPNIIEHHWLWGFRIKWKYKYEHEDNKYWLILWERI